MAQPITTLLIGLGGSGAWTLVHVKRQLYDIYDNRIPKNVTLTVFDTSRNNIPSLGTQRNLRQEGMGVGKTALQESEYVAIGGDAYPVAMDIAKGNRQHMGWFAADYFLKNLPKENFNIDIGAGMYRQFGRMGFFRDVESPGISGIANILDNRLRQLYREKAPNSPAITVVIVGSLVGGTGAGTFIDTAHVVQRVADVSNIPVTVNGFLYLPQAFKAVLKDTDLQSAKVRAFAALRELSRFKTNQDYEYGYPMHYQDARANINPDVWFSSNKGKLYNMVYLVDGEGQGLKMNSTDVKDGVAPVVADAIIAMIDEQYGKKYQEDIINVSSKQQDARQTAGAGAYVSALGAYSVILPIQQIIEGWAHKFAYEMLNVLVPPDQAEGKTVYHLSAGHNPQQGIVPPNDEAKRLLTSSIPMRDPKDTRRVVTPLSLWGMMYGVYSQSLGNMNTTLSQLRARDMGFWLSALVPPSNQADPETHRAISETAGIVNERARDIMIPSNERKPKGNPEQDAAELANYGKRFIDKQLGVVASGGGRKGGDYANALSKFVALHIERYKRYMTAYLSNELNGTESKDDIESKSGRLGWVIAICTEFKTVFSQTYETLSRVITGAGDAFTTAARANSDNQLNYAQKEMFEKRADSRAMFGTPPAIQAQETYISSVQQYLDYYRREFTIEAIVQITKEFRDFTDKLLSELNRWGKLLAIDPKGLYPRIYDGGTDVISDRQKAKDVKNHYVIDDPAWEQDRYSTYAHQEVRANFAKSWEWATDIRKIDGVETFVIDATLDKKPFLRDMIGRWSDDNLDSLLEYCRELFRRALGDVTLLDYLRTRAFPIPKELADLLHKNMAYLLAFQRDATTNVRNVLLAQYRDNPDSQKYLQEVFFELGANLGLGDLRQAGSAVQTTYTSADPFRLTVLSMVEAINMKNTNAYQECLKTYLDRPYDYRQLNHLFLAEINAVNYERRLMSLEQEKRLLQDRVVLLLENEADLLDFLVMLAFGVIKEPSYEEGSTGVRYYYAVELPSKDRSKQGQMEQWHITDVVNEPKLLDAAARYVLIGKDYRNEDRTIPKDEAGKYLRYMQDVDLEDRVNRDDLALNDAELRGWLERAFMPPLDADGNNDLSNWTPEDDANFVKISRRIVIYDVLMGVVGYMREKLPQLKSRMKQIAIGMEDANLRIESELHAQEEYDFYTVAILALSDEAEKYRDNVRRDYNAKTGKR